MKIKIISERPFQEDKVEGKALLLPDLSKVTCK
jgi:hypothetical protein